MTSDPSGLLDLPSPFRRDALAAPVQPLPYGGLAGADLPRQRKLTACDPNGSCEGWLTIGHTPIFTGLPIKSTDIADVRRKNFRVERRHVVFW